MHLINIILLDHGAKSPQIRSLHIFIQLPTVNMLGIANNKSSPRTKPGYASNYVRLNLLYTVNNLHIKITTSHQ